MTPSCDVPTFCRICEPCCGLVASVLNGRIESLRPDREHPVTRGYACRKGLALLDVHRDPDRVDHPLQRRASGDGFDARDWDTAAGEIAGKLRSILDRHGPAALGFYSGNPLGFYAIGSMSAQCLFGPLGTFRYFNAGTQDCANKFATSEAIFGSRNIHPLPDIDRADLILSFGANPRVSHGSFMSAPNVMSQLRAAVARGARVHHVNPREIEKSAGGVGDTLLIRPDTDVYLLAALLCELESRGAWDEGALAAHATNVESLRDFVRRYPAERVAAVCGIPCAKIRELADEIASAGRVAVHMSTGVNMGRQGSLAYCLLYALSLATGNLDRPGGNVQSVGFYPNARSGRGDFARGFTATEFGVLRRGGLPGNLLSHYILDAEEPIRALVVAAGNPLLSIGGEQRLREAFASLELLVVIDLYANATSEYAHWVLPATDPFEREDLTVIGLGFQYEPWVQHTPRVVEPAYDRRNEWWIFARLAKAMGLASPIDGAGEAEYWAKFDHMLSSSGLSLDALRKSPRGVVLEPLRTGSFFDEIVQHPGGRVDVCPDAFAPALERCELLFGELASEPADSLKLITKRDPWMHNSWLHNVEAMHRRGRDANLVYVHPDDAKSRDLEEGDRVRLHNEYGAIELALAFDADLRPGVVAVVHGWGHARAPGMREARRAAGANVNRLLPIGPDSFEPLSSQSHMTGVRVELVAASESDAPG